jgi:5'-AMP-activated protein kinase regulatory gamma subunit
MSHLYSLYVAISMLVKHKIHRLPIIDQSTGNAIYVLTHKRILHHLYHNVICGSELPMPAYMHKSIGELEIGTYSSIATASQDTAIIAALNVFAERRVSALPIVSPDGASALHHLLTCLVAVCHLFEFVHYLSSHCLPVV